MESPRYHEHRGTIRVAAISDPASFATKAVQMLGAIDEHIDFFCVGPNASQQAVKILTLFRAFYEQNTNGVETLAFIPHHVHTMAPPLDKSKGTEMELLNATVFRTMILSAEQTKQFLLQTEPKDAEWRPKQKKQNGTRNSHQRNPKGT